MLSVTSFTTICRDGSDKSYNFTDDKSELQRAPSMSSTPPFSWVWELELYVEWEERHSTRVMEKSAYLNSCVRLGTLTQAFLWSHRSSPSPCAPHLLDLREHWTTFAMAMSKPQHGWQWSFQMDVEMHLCLFWKWSPGCLWCVVVFPEASGSVFEWLDHPYLTSTWSCSLQTELSLR